MSNATMDVANGVFHVVGFANYALLYGTNRVTETLYIYKYNDGIWRLVKKKGKSREYDILYEAPCSATVSSQPPAGKLECPQRNGTCSIHLQYVANVGRLVRIVNTWVDCHIWFVVLRADLGGCCAYYSSLFNQPGRNTD